MVYIGGIYIGGIYIGGIYMYIGGICRAICVQPDWCRGLICASGRYRYQEWVDSCRFLCLCRGVKHLHISALCI